VGVAHTSNGEVSGAAVLEVANATIEWDNVHRSCTFFSIACVSNIAIIG